MIKAIFVDDILEKYRNGGLDVIVCVRCESGHRNCWMRSPLGLAMAAAWIGVPAFCESPRFAGEIF
jgi:hypothetical protein